MALVPPTVQRLVKAGHEVVVESGAGDGAFFPDAGYAAAGRSRGRTATRSSRAASVLLGGAAAARERYSRHSPPARW